ncbi:hypothetical protein GUJ93_ZPchr0006g46096 [Zizania palustris]|uniref:Uncharacterized protein n=1 Tax=Zizania palustris TaxID=103762 RepID=A0A8J5T5F2_ZIZPA|nr:hypothetical protein GUJ93_ZPchr0006g46096 [Zizania palustris]
MVVRKRSSNEICDRIKTSVCPSTKIKEKVLKQRDLVIFTSRPQNSKPSPQFKELKGKRTQIDWIFRQTLFLSPRKKEWCWGLDHIKRRPYNDQGVVIITVYTLENLNPEYSLNAKSRDVDEVIS